MTPGTKIEVKGWNPYTGERVCYPARIARSHPSWGKLPEGWHHVRFDGSERAVSMHRDSFVVVVEPMMIEIVDVESGAIVVCDTALHCCSLDDGIRDQWPAIEAALLRGNDYLIGGGAAAEFVIRRAPQNTIAG
jgi:hypothetical protein